MSEFKRVEFVGTPEEAIRTLYDLPGILAGTIPDRYGLVKLVQVRVAVAMLREVQLDFITKMRGGRGRDGIQWPPLKPETIAQRRITAAEFKAAKLDKKRHKHRGILSEEMDLEWRKKFGQVMAWARMDRDEKSAKGLAAALAWKHVKSLGAKTRLELFGNRVVDILRDTAKLFRSLSPGFSETNLPMPLPEGQVIIIAPGRIAVGSSEKPWHHEGIPGRLPSRPFWPLSGEIPAAWWEGINRAFVAGIQEIAALLLQKGREAA